MSDDVIAIKAYVPKALKRQAFAAFQFHDLNFGVWTRQHLERWLQEVGAPREPREPGKAEPSIAEVSR
jgi:hypothetical protein